MMDQLSAHLDRGWDLAQRGDAQGASASARRALELCPNSPEVHNLLGFVHALQGDCEEAVEAYRQATELDEGYVEAMLNAAELMVHPLGEYADALEMVECVLTVTDYGDEVLDAYLLRIEALQLLGDNDAAKQTIERLPDGPYDNPAHNYLAGRCLLESGDLERAALLLSRALEQEPHNADAQYYFGLLCEEQGNRHAAAQALLRSRQLELEMGMPPWAPNAETFLLFTEKAIDALDEEMRAIIADAELYIADMPGPELVVDGVDPRALTVGESILSRDNSPAGVGLGERDLIGPARLDARLPDAVTDDLASAEAALAQRTPLLRVFLYAMNVLRSAAGIHDVQQHITEALAQEIQVNFFGEALEEPRKVGARDKRPEPRRRSTPS